MTTITPVRETLQAYFDAWNRGDAQALAAILGPEGTYSDPAAGDGLPGPALAGYAGALFAAFPDLSFDVQEPRPCGPGSFAVEWVMRGTNTGLLRGAPPTGARVALPGVDLIEARDGRLASVRAYFDQKTFLEQLGMQVTAAPRRVGAATFGTALRLETEVRDMPAAMSLTMLQVRTDEEVEWVRQETRRMLPEIGRTRGFLGLTTAVVGRRLYTMAAWAGPEDAHQLRSGAHAEAMRAVYGGRVGEAGLTGIWAPVILTARVRCGGCGEWRRSDGVHRRCACGAGLPERPPLW